MSDPKSLAQSLLDATTRQDYAAAEVTARREALTDALRRLWEQGIKATIPIDGLGKAEWRTYEPTARIRDQRAFTDWAANVTTTRLTIRTALAPEARAALTEAGIEFTEETVLRDTDRDAILNRLAPTDDGQAVSQDGELVPGVVFETQQPNLYVTVDADRKAAERRLARMAVIQELAGDA